MTDAKTVDAEVWPEGSLEVLSHLEVDQLRDGGEGGVYPLLRRCMLAVLNSGSQMDDTRAVLQRFESFDVGFIPRDRGLKVSVKGAPADAFVDGKMIRGIRSSCSPFCAISYSPAMKSSRTRASTWRAPTARRTPCSISCATPGCVTPANVDIVVCWGGHAIGREEYDYTKLVGYELGLRGINVCTGCGPGAMKGPMKGATIGHAKQRIRNGRYIGITEPGIIAAEAPNPIVNSLVIMPDMEKRLEAFVRVGHGITVFPGRGRHGRGDPLPARRAAAPGQCRAAIAAGHDGACFIRSLLPADRRIRRADARSRGAETVFDHYRRPRDRRSRNGPGLEAVHEFRSENGDAYYFNWRLQIDRRFQEPFSATHENMESLQISEDLAPHELAANLRRAFSGIVSGNVRDDTAAAIEDRGPFQINGSARIMGLLDELARVLRCPEAHEDRRRQLPALLRDRELIPGH